MLAVSSGHRSTSTTCLQITSGDALTTIDSERSIPQVYHMVHHTDKRYSAIASDVSYDPLLAHRTRDRPESFSRTAPSPYRRHDRHPSPARRGGDPDSQRVTVARARK